MQRRKGRSCRRVRVNPVREISQTCSIVRPPCPGFVHNDERLKGCLTGLGAGLGAARPDRGRRNDALPVVNERRYQLAIEYDDGATGYGATTYEGDG